MSEEKETLIEENGKGTLNLMAEKESVAIAETALENKRKRIIIAFTAGAVVLLFFLIALMVYQMIAITGKKNQVLKLKSDIVALEQTYAHGEDTIEARKQRWYIERRARELGYAYADDIVTD